MPTGIECVTPVKHEPFNDGAAVQLQADGVKDEACVQRERFEHALDHLESVGTLKSGYVGLHLGVDIG